MKVRVNQQRCVGSGQCVRTAPEVFDQREHDGIVLIIDGAAIDVHAQAIRKAARLCPAQAISIEESNT